jgi:hypothetical protein
MMNKCLHCNYEWEGIKENPKQCTQCKNYRWNILPIKPSRNLYKAPPIADNPKEAVMDTPPLSFKERLALKKQNQLNVPTESVSSIEALNHQMKGGQLK